MSSGPGRPWGLGYVGAAALTGVYAAAGYTRVVVDYVMEERNHVDRFRRAGPGALANPFACSPCGHRCRW